MQAVTTVVDSGCGFRLLLQAVDPNFCLIWIIHSCVPVGGLWIQICIWIQIYQQAGGSILAIEGPLCTSSPHTHTLPPTSRPR